MEPLNKQGKQNSQSNQKVFTPTQAVTDNILRGQVLKQKYQRGSLQANAAQAKITKSKQMFDQGYTIDAVKQMYYTLSKLEHTDLRKAMYDGGPTEDAILFYAHGGSAGLAWSRMVLQQEQILKSYTKKIEPEQTHQQGNDSIAKIPVAKALNEELMQATFIVMIPDEVDAHGDTATVEEVRKACFNFNKHSRQANLFHMVETDTFEFCESYIVPTDIILGEHLVKAGTWVATVQCLSEELWSLIKQGEICALSIGALANAETLE